MSDFEAFSVLHWLCLFSCAIVCVAAFFLARRWRDTEKAKWFRNFIGYGCLIAWVIRNLYRFFTRDFDWGTSLPLHFCHIANLIGAVAVLGRGRFFKGVSYFWACALCSWAFLTPDLGTGPAHPGFWIFWGYHLFIPLVVVEIFVLQGFRPNWRDLRNSLIFTAAYVVLLLIPNNLFGWNYGFVGPKNPSVPTIIDFFGPYPLRLIWMVLIGAFLFFLLQLPWLKKSSR